VELNDAFLPTVGVELDRAWIVPSGRVGSAKCRLLPLAPAVDIATASPARHRVYDSV